MSAARVLVVFVLAVLVGVCALGPPSAGTAVGITITVNSHGDSTAPQFSCTQAGFFCTLRLAIERANSNPGIDTIVFDPATFPSGDRTITPTAQLPFILAHEGITIDGGGSQINIIPANGVNPDFGLVFLSSVGQSAQNIILKDIFIRDSNYDAVQVCAGNDTQSATCIGAVSNVTFENVRTFATDNWGITVRGSSITDVQFTNTGASIASAQSAALLKASGPISDVSITGGTFGYAGGSGLEIDAGTSSVSRVTLDSITVDTNEEYGVAIRGNAIQDVEISGLTSKFNDLGGVTFTYSGPLERVSVDTSTFTEDGLAVFVFPTDVTATIDGLDIIGNNADESETIAVLGYGISNVLIANNQLTDGSNAGIELYNFSNTVSGSGNIIRENSVSYYGSGITLIGNVQAKISRNAAYNNDRLGINLLADTDPPDDVTPNDPGDTDNGPNGLLNYPTLAVATDEELIGAACANCLIEMFGAAPDPSGYGEGTVFLRDVLADANGDFTMSLCQLDLDDGDTITTTATDPSGNTSEFSYNYILGIDTSDTCIPPTPIPTTVPPTTPPATATTAPATTAPATTAPVTTTAPSTTAPSTTAPSSPTTTSEPVVPTQGDLNCDGDIDGDDAILPLVFDAELTLPSGGACPAIGSGDPDWGDVNCDERIDALDALLILTYFAGVPLDTPTDCTPIGDPF